MMQLLPTLWYLEQTPKCDELSTARSGSALNKQRPATHGRVTLLTERSSTAHERPQQGLHKSHWRKGSANTSLQHFNSKRSATSYANPATKSIVVCLGAPDCRRSFVIFTEYGNTSEESSRTMNFFRRVLRGQTEDCQTKRQKKTRLRQ